MTYLWWLQQSCVVLLLQLRMVYMVVFDLLCPVLIYIYLSALSCISRGCQAPIQAHLCTRRPHESLDIVAIRHRQRARCVVAYIFARRMAIRHDTSYVYIHPMSMSTFDHFHRRHVPQCIFHHWWSVFAEPRRLHCHQGWFVKKRYILG